MSHGQDFEDALVESLEEWVGDDGVVLLRRQSFSMRGGQFQGTQELDILVDSRDRDKYVGVEAKSRNAESRPGFYFSSDLNIEQMEDEIEYREKSGRKVAVAVELRNYDGCDGDRCAWLVPVELFTSTYERGEKKVSWEQVEQYGHYIGCDGDYAISQQVFDAVDSMSE